MAAAQRQILRTAHDLDELAPISPAELAAGFTDPALRAQIVGGMLVMSLTDGPPSEARIAPTGLPREAPPAASASGSARRRGGRPVPAPSASSSAAPAAPTADGIPDHL